MEMAAEITYLSSDWFRKGPLDVQLGLSQTNVSFEP